jgi:tetrahydromethanopterin S-methyltransferase subunit B
VQAAVYSIADITHDTILSSGHSDQFRIISGGPHPEVSVTVIARSILSTVGGTTFTAFTPGVNDATASDSYASPTVIVATTTDNSAATQTSPPAGANVKSTSSSRQSAVQSLPTASATAASSSSTSTATATGGATTGTIIGVVVGLILLVLFCLVLGGLYFLMRRRKAAKAVDDQTIQLSGRTASHDHVTVEKEVGALRYLDDDYPEEMYSGRINTTYESHNTKQ